MFIMSHEGINVFFDGVPYWVSNDHIKYDDILELVRNDGSYNDFMKLLNTPTKTVDGVDELVYEDGSIFYVDGGARWELDEVLQEEVVLRNKNGMPLTAIVNFCKNLFQNPSYDSRLRTFHFLKNEGLPITEDGCFLAYKYVRSDYYDKHTGTVYYGDFGKPVKEPRELCDDNPNNSCSKGLHVGGLSYAKVGPITLVMKVNPKNVVTVPTNESQKMRCCEVTPVKIYEEKLKDFYDEDANEITVNNAREIKADKLHNNIGDIEFYYEGYLRCVEIDKVGNGIISGYLNHDDEYYDFDLPKTEQYEFFLTDKMEEIFVL